MKQRKKKLKEELRSFWFIPLRLSVFLLLFGAVVLTESSQKLAFWPFLLYSLTTLIFLLVIEIDARFFRPGFLQSIIFIQFVFELVAEGSILHSARLLTSQYSILFLLTIVSASLVYRLVGTLTIATIASFTYASTFGLSRIFEQGGDFSLDQFARALQGDDVFYAIFLHVCTFYMVAFISGFLAQKLRAKEGELSHASEELERVQLDTDEILQNLHSGLVSIDNTGKIVYFNRAAENILGYRSADVKGRGFLEVFGAQMPELCDRVVSVLKQAKPNVRTELEIECKNGSRIPLGLSASILGDERIGVRGVVVVFQDLTVAKEMEKALLKADRLAAVGELSARIAHEIRNPLASISGSVEVLRSEMSLNGDNARLMELIVRESERLSRILTDFLNYARTSPVLSTKIELVSIVSNTIDLIRHSHQIPKGVIIEFEAANSTEYIIGDEDQVRQVVINLVVNAVEAVDREVGKVYVTVGPVIDDVNDRGAGWVLLTVFDNGCGFNNEIKEKLFEPFFSRKKGGTGLGLAIVKRSLDSIGGQIAVQSTPGAGAKFNIFFRRYVPIREESPVQTESHSQTSSVPR